MTPAARADEARRRGHMETLDRLEWQEKPGLPGPVRDVAAVGFNERRTAVAHEADNPPGLIADEDAVSGAKGIGVPGHPADGCTARS